MPPTPPLAALIADLDRRLAAAAQEARLYPGPIARCDDQLPALLERRRRLREALDLARQLQQLLDDLA